MSRAGQIAGLAMLVAALILYIHPITQNGITFANNPCPTAISSITVGSPIDAGAPDSGSFIGCPSTQYFFWVSPTADGPPTNGVSASVSTDSSGQALIGFIAPSAAGSYYVTISLCTYSGQSNCYAFILTPPSSNAYYPITVTSLAPTYYSYSLRFVLQGTSTPVTSLYVGLSSGVQQLTNSSGWVTFSNLISNSYGFTYACGSLTCQGTFSVPPSGSQTVSVPVVTSSTTSTTTSSTSGSSSSTTTSSSSTSKTSTTGLPPVSIDLHLVFPLILTFGGLGLIASGGGGRRRA